MLDANKRRSPGLLLRRVDPPAVAPDLALGPGERLEVAHLDHGRGEGGGEGGCVGREVADSAVGAGVVEELLVGVQEPPLVEQVGVVGVVEGVGRGDVQRRQVGVAACGGAVGPERRGEGGVDVGLGDVVPEVEALRLSDCVSTCMHASKID